MTSEGILNNMQVTTLLPELYIFRGTLTGERNRGYALLMKANKPETALYRAPTFPLLLLSHGGISTWQTNQFGLQIVAIEMV